MRLVTSIIFLVTLLCACKKDKVEKQEFLTCTPNPNLDSSAIIQQLHGKWRLSKMRSNSTGEPRKVDADLNVVFSENGTYQLFEGTVLRSGGNTILMRVGNVSWGLNTTNQFFLGVIQMCNDQLVFENDYEESSDSLFEKVN